VLKSVQDLVVWQRAMSLVRDVYFLASRLTPHERFELGSQLRRCAISIPSNIAEGYARETRKEYIRYLIIARGSRAELETQLLILKRVKYITPGQLEPVYRRQAEVGAMLATLIRRLQARPRDAPRSSKP
jgi:four helix bundle protein